MFKRLLMTALLATAIALPVSLMAKHAECGGGVCNCTKEKNCGCEMNKSKCSCDMKKGKTCESKKGCGCKMKDKAPACETKPVCETKTKCGCPKDANTTIVIDPAKK